MSFTRRALVATALAAPLGTAQAQQTRVPRVTLLGDSLTSGYGLPASAALPAQLQSALRSLGVSATVARAGVSGDTTAKGLARVDRAVAAATRLCVVALGANDMLNFIDPAVSKANLDAILTRLKARGVTPLLAGVAPPIEIGGSYVADFKAIFPELARKHRVALHPDLLAGIAFVPRYNQADRIHPNAEGVRIMAERLAPAVREALR